MPAQGNFDPERFAMLVSRFDTGNPSEYEAMNAALMMRRMVAERNMRFVDVFGRPDVTQALDALLKPVREESEELKAAFLEVAKFAELARAQTEMVNDLRRQLAARSGGVTATVGVVSGRFVAVTVVAAILLMIAAQWNWI